MYDVYIYYIYIWHIYWERIVAGAARPDRQIPLDVKPFMSLMKDCPNICHMKIVRANVKYRSRYVNWNLANQMSHYFDMLE